MRVLCLECNKYRALTKYSRLRIHPSPNGGLCRGSGQLIDPSEEHTVQEPQRLPRRIRNRQRGGVLD